MLVYFVSIHWLFVFGLLVAQIHSFIYVGCQSRLRDEEIFQLETHYSGFDGHFLSIPSNLVFLNGSTYHVTNTMGLELTRNKVNI